MFKYLKRKNQKGQSALEYAVLIVIVIAALLSMQVYIKRGIGGRLKSAADSVGIQYSDGNTNFNSITNTVSNTRETFSAGQSNYVIDQEDTSVSTNQEIIHLNQEFWGDKQTEE